MILHQKLINTLSAARDVCCPLIIFAISSCRNTGSSSDLNLSELSGFAGHSAEGRSERDDF